MGLPKILDPNASSEKIKDRVSTKQAFQQMWVAGSLGAFFIAIARTLPGDIAQLVNPPKGVRFFDLAAVTALRYFYLLWLIWYFFLSNLRRQPNDLPSVNDIPFDVVQSICALTAAYFLDFILPNTHHAPRVAFVAVSIAIALISLLSLFWFGKNDTVERLNNARWLGSVMALVSLAGACCIPRNWRDYVFAGAMTIPLAFLYKALLMFHKKRVDTVDPPGNPTVDPKSLPPRNPQRMVKTKLLRKPRKLAMVV